MHANLRSRLWRPLRLNHRSFPSTSVVKGCGLPARITRFRVTGTRGYSRTRKSVSSSGPLQLKVLRVTKLLVRSRGIVPARWSIRMSFPSLHLSNIIYRLLANQHRVALYRFVLLVHCPLQM